MARVVISVASHIPHQKRAGMESTRLDVVRQSFESLLRHAAGLQIGYDWIVSILDDGSCEAGSELLYGISLKHPRRVFYERQDEKREPFWAKTAARKIALSRYEPEFFAQIDDDFWYSHGWLGKMLDIFKTVEAELKAKGKSLAAATGMCHPDFKMDWGDEFRTGHVAPQFRCRFVTSAPGGNWFTRAEYVQEMLDKELYQGGSDDRMPTEFFRSKGEIVSVVDSLVQHDGRHGVHSHLHGGGSEYGILGERFVGEGAPHVA